MTVKQLILKLIDLCNEDSINEEKEVYMLPTPALRNNEREEIDFVHSEKDYIFLSPYDEDGMRKGGKG